ncbi:MAG: transposase [Acidimicrobiales bacterium]
MLVDAAFYRVLLASDDKTLAGTKYLWLYPKENLPERHKDRFATLRGGDLKTARGLAIKESLRDFWSYKRWGWAEKHWKRWYFWATHPASDRRGPHLEASRGWADVLLRTSRVQRWCGA